MGLRPADAGLYDNDEDFNLDRLFGDEGGDHGSLRSSNASVYTNADEVQWNRDSLEFAKKTLINKGIDVSEENIAYLQKDEELQNMGYSGLVRKLREDRGAAWNNAFDDAQTRSFDAQQDLGNALRVMGFQRVETIFASRLRALVTNGISRAVSWARNDRMMQNTVAMRQPRTWAQAGRNYLGYTPLQSSDDVELGDLGEIRTLLAEKEHEFLTSPKYAAAFADYKDAYEMLLSELDSGLRHDSDTSEFKKDFPKACDAVIKARQALNKAWLEMNSIPSEIVAEARAILRDQQTTQTAIEGARNARSSYAATARTLTLSVAGGALAVVGATVAVIRLTHG